MVPEVLALCVFSCLLRVQLVSVDRPDDHHVLIVLSEASKPPRFRKNGLGRISVLYGRQYPGFSGILSSRQALTCGIRR
jgi:hypothetical protein